MMLSIALILLLFVILAVGEALRVREGDWPTWIRMILAFGLVVLPPIFDLILASESVKIPRRLDPYLLAGLVLVFLLFFTVRDFLRARERGEAALRQIINYVLSKENGKTTQEEVTEYLVEMRQEDRGRVERLADWCLTRLAQQGFIIPVSGEELR